MQRNFQDPQYKAWRLAVKRRDRFRCVMCGSRRRLHAHHIKPWAEYPTLRYALGNGATLCRSCHRKVTCNELMYEARLLRLINPLGFLAIQMELFRQRDGEGEKAP